MPTKPKTDGRESRAVSVLLELRAAGGDAGPGTATGYAVPYNSVTDIGGWWQEVFAPGAFTRSIAERDVVALHSHDWGRVVGRTSAKTLSLREDQDGVAFENPLPDTSDGRDLAVSLGRGDIAGMSFGFRSRKEEWDETVDPPKRTITDADLFEITYSADPQYSDSEVGLRSLEHARNERRQLNRTAASHRIAERRARQAQMERGIL